MSCRSCGAENAPGARFCGSCGSRLTSTCPHCGADTAPGLRFCNTCGGPLPEAAFSSLGAEPGAARDPTAVAERRLVSVLFVDLEGFTALAESLDPEDVRNLQAVYFEAARSVVARFDGTIEKFIGDAVMAVWGAPTAHGDDGIRAVRAALELVAAVAKLRGVAAGRRLAARAAVATGEVAVTLGMEGHGMVAGDLVNTAARLQAVAPVNGVLVDETTRRVAGDVIAFEPAGRTALKGRRQAITTWRAVESAASGGQARAAGHRAPFVGRAQELAELGELYRRTASSGRSRLISVVGIAGIGKSRLAWELERHLEALPEPVALHVGGVPAYGDGITFAPLAEMVRRRARIAERVETELARRQLSVALAEFIPDEAERAWVEPRLATLLDPGSHGGFERDELFAAWRRFFERVAVWAPAVLIFEDLQWADPALLDFVDHLAVWSRDHPILIVTLARPELLDRRPTWGAEQPSFTSIRLEPLDDGAMAELLGGLAPGLAGDDVARIVARAGGVPLYGVEVIRMLLDRGQARLEDGRFALLEPLEQVAIPETLQSLVSARIDALPRPERAHLLAASVLGRRFHPAALEAISRLHPGEASVRTAALVRRELLTVDEEFRSPARGQLSFVQLVVREVAYRTLSRNERRELHLAAADHLGTLEDAELVEAVAEHLVDAHVAAPDRPDAAAIAARAVTALRTAADRAMTLHVPVRALAHLQLALELVDGEATRAEVWAEAAVAARAAPDFELAERLLRGLIAWQVEHGTREAAARARAQLASLLLATERHASAINDLESALEGLADPEADASTVELTGQLARARVLVGQNEEARAWADRTVTAARRFGLDAVAVDALTTRGTARMRAGDEAAGAADLRDAIAEADRLGLVGAGLRARNNLAWLVALEDPHRTLATAREGLELATRMGVGDMVLQLGEVVSSASIATGDLEGAKAVLEAMRERPQAPAHRLQFVVNEARLRALQGDPGASSLLDALEPIHPETDPQLIAAIDDARSWIALVEGRIADAHRLAMAAGAASFGAEQHHAFELAARAGLWSGDRQMVRAARDRLGKLDGRGRVTAAASLTLEAGVAALAADPAATTHYAQAAALWRDLRLPLQLALCLADRARLVPEADGPDAAPLAEAQRILRGLGAHGLARAVHPGMGQADGISKA